MSERSESNRITCLHGFLGLPSDWDFLRDAGFEVETPPLDNIPPEGDVLLGYSMGGRLALRALCGTGFSPSGRAEARPTYRRAVIISARISAPEPGRPDWSRRFESEEWDTLIRDWNAQPIFGGHIMPRDERDFDRRELVRQLREWAPVAFEGEIPIPVLFIAGERDPKYVDEALLATRYARHAEVWICPGAAHRVPWEQPALFIERLREFVA